ncbi:MAG TPA: single-stranded DNA-binding protein [Ktedonobacterales bacterium]|jgi:single-strand DNA-binding protein|nr:single-stranded DNA-binding protein [Ktedonobacterales bacterium]
MNKIMLIGNLGKDPELNYTPSGTAITKFTMAVNRRMRDRESGEKRDETTWFNIVAWNQLAETCNQYLHKGSKVYIEGRMTSRKFTDKDGNERTAWEVTANEMEMLDPKGQSQGSSSGSGYDDMTADEVPF